MEARMMQKGINVGINGVNDEKDAATNPEEYVSDIRRGQRDREDFIRRYQPFIAAIVSRMVNAPAQGRDEYSVALTAFNDAIDTFDASRSPGFLHYCDIIINRHVIDYIRANRRHAAVWPFTYFEAAGNEHIIERALVQNPDMLVEHLEIKDEIEIFKKRLARFNITLRELTECSPKHLDSRLLCMNIAERIAESDELHRRLELMGQLPIAQLTQVFSINRKTIENNRKYLIALYVVITSGLETIKGYLDFIRRGVSNR